MNRLITTVIMGLVSITTIAQVSPSRPKLVVGIVVDQLRTDYIEYLQSMLGEKGFRKLMNHGVYFRDVNFNVSSLDKVNATAMIFTGNYPSATGVSRASIYNPQLLKSQPALMDADVMGNFTSETYSPRPLLLSTVSDEIMIDGAGLGVVYSFSTDPQQAIIMTGHAGNGAFWINENTGKWSASTYYKDMPQPVSQRNYKYSLASRIDTMQWKPSRDIKTYPGIPAQKKYYPFRYTFPTSDRNVYRMFSESPLANEEVTTLAIDCLRSLNIGNRGDAIDMLNVGYSAAPFKYVKDGDYRLELMDSYIRLDAQLERLFTAIDKLVGLQNTLIFLSSTGYYDDATPDNPKYGIPGGTFSVKRASSLLNAYLSAKFSNGDYIKAFDSNQFYLNHQLIEEKRLDISDVTESAREFLCRMSGIAEAFTLTDILSSRNETTESLRLSLDPRTAGDIIVRITPGWNLTDDSKFPVQTTHSRSSMVCTPAFIMGHDIKPETISTPVNATILAPTLTQVLRIRSPNGTVERAKLL